MCVAQREISFNDTHSKAIGYLLWIFGFTGAHRFYYGKPVTGTLWFLTFGLFGIGWLIDLFLIPGMDRQADLRFQAGPTSYTLAWILLSADTFSKVYGLDASQAVVPFSQPGIITIPLGFLTLVVVSLMTQEKDSPATT